MTHRLRMARKRLMVAREREAKIAPRSLHTDIGDQRWTAWHYKHMGCLRRLRAIERRKEKLA